jgi:hypothetical protein
MAGIWFFEIPRELESEDDIVTSTIRTRTLHLNAVDEFGPFW